LPTANRNFDIWKKDGWDSVALERIDDATQEGRGAEVGAIILGEGTAAVCLLTEHMMVVRQRIDVPVPRKRKGQSGVHEKVRLAPDVPWLASNCLLTDDLSHPRRQWIASSRRAFRPSCGICRSRRSRRSSSPRLASREMRCVDRATLAFSLL
jgi:hypothetical protein